MGLVYGISSYNKVTRSLRLMRELPDKLFLYILITYTADAAILTRVAQIIAGIFNSIIIILRVQPCDCQLPLNQFFHRLLLQEIFPYKLLDFFLFISSSSKVSPSLVRRAIKPAVDLKHFSIVPMNVS